MLKIIELKKIVCAKILLVVVFGWIETIWSQSLLGLLLVRDRDGITNSMDMSLSKFWEIVKDREAQSAAVHGVKKRPTRLSG